MTYENHSIGDHRGSSTIIGKVIFLWLSRWLPTNNRKINNRLKELLLVIMFLVTLVERIGMHEPSRSCPLAWDYKSLMKKMKIALLLWQLLKECNSCPSISLHAPKLASLLHFLCWKIRCVFLQSKTMDKICVFTSNSLKGTLYTCNEPPRSTLRALAPLHALFSSGMIQGWFPGGSGGRSPPC